MALVTIKVTEETRRQAKAAAALRDMSMIDWIYEAVIEKAETEKRQAQVKDD